MNVKEILKGFIADKSCLIKESRDIPNLGTVHFRSLPGAYVMKLIPKAKLDAEGNEVLNSKGEVVYETSEDNAQQSLDIIKNTACDEKGNLLFAGEFESVLDDIPMEMLNPLLEGGMTASGLTQKADEEIEKNSEAVA